MTVRLVEPLPGMRYVPIPTMTNGAITVALPDKGELPRFVTVIDVWAVVRVAMVGKV